MPDAHGSTSGVEPQRTAADNTDRAVDDDFHLAPVECASRDEYEAARSGWKKQVLREAETPPPVEPRSSKQFSLMHLLALTTLIAIGLGGGAMLTPKIFALVCGVVAVVSVVAANFQEKSPLRTICLMSVLVYAIAAASAFVRTFLVE